MKIIKPGYRPFIALGMVFGLLLFSGAPFSLGQSNEQKEVRSISQINEDLSKIKVKAMESFIPPSAIPLFSELKNAILNQISNTINNQSVKWISTSDLKRILSDKLQKEGMQLPKEDEEEKSEYSYEQCQDIGIETPLHYDNLLVITSTLWVMCGSDTSFYLFQKEGDKWKLILSEEAKGYNEITGAHSWFGYSLSPPDKTGNFYVVTANVNPWCSSNWQGLRYTVYRPGQSPYNPKILFKNKITIYLGVDPPVYTIDTKADSFKLELNGDWYFTPDTGASLQYVEYKVYKDKVKQYKKGRLNK